MPEDLTPSEQLTHATVRIECMLADGSPSTGSGFFFRFKDLGTSHVPAIVTNKHVVRGARTGKFHLTLADSQGKQPQLGKQVVFTLDNFEQRWIPHPDPNVDLCVMPITPLLNDADARKIRFFYIGLSTDLIPSDTDLVDLGAAEDILMIGYPNGIWDHVNNLPVIRRGITATHCRHDYQGRREFMIDAACFPGSSGSPVFLYNEGSWRLRNGNTKIGGVRIKLLGILYAGPQHTAEGKVVVVDVPTQATPVAISRIPNNLGLVIKASRLLEIDALFPDPAS